MTPGLRTHKQGRVFSLKLDYNGHALIHVCAFDPRGQAICGWDVLDDAEIPEAARKTLLEVGSRETGAPLGGPWQEVTCSPA